MSQKISNINLSDLVLWTENPRDPISSSSTDQDIADRAWKTRSDKWQLKKLAKDMKSHYDLSELPTVVYHNNHPIVYDGNRRVILAKLKHKLIHLDGFDLSLLPDTPNPIPCNVCSKEIALKNVLRKHAETGSWSPLQRDVFLHKHMHEKKSIFLKLEEATHFISNNPTLDKRFVRDEIFKLENMKELGFRITDDGILSKHSEAETNSILNDILAKVTSKQITTRRHRGKVFEILDENNKLIINKNIREKEYTEISNTKNGKSEKHHDVDHEKQPKTPILRKSARTRGRSIEMFGETLYLQRGQVSDLYRDIVDLSKYYQKNKKELSHHFPCILRMSLRLLCETAAKDKQETLKEFIEKRFDKSKKDLSQDDKTLLSNQNITKQSLTQLLHTGAHSYKASANFEQTIAISVIVGRIISLSHGKKN